MTDIEVKGLEPSQINDRIRAAEEDCRLLSCCGQRFIGAGLKEKHVTIQGIPGNALGAYLDGGSIEVHSNAQDAVGDTMNDGAIIVHGSIGDAAGYAMRGGRIYVKGDAGYRAGIHMKEYKEKVPVMIIGGRTGSFLGEYQAGGVIAVLGLTAPERKIVGNFPCTGMHGGRVFIRGTAEDIHFPDHVCARPATGEDLESIAPEIRRFCEIFGYDAEKVLCSPFTLVTPDTSNPYKQMYVAN